MAAARYSIFGPPRRGAATASRPSASSALGGRTVIVLEILSRWVLPFLLLGFVAVVFWAILRPPRRTW